MTDIVGPASSINAVTARPSDGRQYGVLDTWFKDCSSASTQDGTQVAAAWLNQVTGFFRNLIRANGLKLDGVTPVVPLDQSDNMVLNGILHLIQRGQVNFAVDTGTADAILATPAVAPAEYKAGMRFLVLKNPGVAANATTTPTINFGLGNLTVVKSDTSPLGIGDLRRGGIFEVELDGINARLTQLMAISDVVALIVSNGGVVYAPDTGTADALVAQTQPAITAYQLGMLTHVHKGAAANTTTAPTIALNTLPAKTILKRDGNTLAPGDLPTTSDFLLAYDGTFQRLMGPANSDILGLVAGASVGRGGQTYYASGTFTVPANVFWIYGIVWGAGGGGGGANGSGAAGSGGGGGGYAYGWKQVTPGQVITITVGVGGAAGPAGGGAPTGGGTTSIGSLMSATGGANGVGSTSGPQNTYFGSQGSGSGGTVNLGGVPGSYAYQVATGQLISGQGGGAPQSTGGTGVSSNAIGLGGNFPGGGGGGGNGNVAGGAGANGLAIILY